MFLEVWTLDTWLLGIIGIFFNLFDKNYTLVFLPFHARLQSILQGESHKIDLLSIQIDKYKTILNHYIV